MTGWISPYIIRLIKNQREQKTRRCCINRCLQISAINLQETIQFQEILLNRITMVRRITGWHIPLIILLITDERDETLKTHLKKFTWHS